jgi:signal transduction histidine kinase
LDARDVAVLDEETKRLESLLQSFLDFARPAPLEMKEVDLAAIIRQTVEFLAGRAERREIRIACRLPTAPVVAEADPVHFRQVLLNLLLNALDAVRNGGQIWIEAGTDEPGPSGADATGLEERRVRIRVADNGCGLPAGERDRLYEPFFSTKETGLGLGLAVCRRIVQAHGGEIRESDREGGGAVFEVLLPGRRKPVC